MNVYFAGGEDVDFTVTGNVVSNTAAGNYRTTFARAITFVTGTSTTWPLANSAMASFGNRSSFWWHAYDTLLSGALAAGSILLGFADNSGVGRLFVRCTGAAGQLKISKRNAAGTFTDLVASASALWSANVLSPLDLFVNYAVSGQATLYLNGVVIADTGPGVDVTTDGAASLAQLYLGSASSAGGGLWSEVVIADSDTRAFCLWLMNSSTAGNAQTWTGTASSVNKAIINDATFVSAASAGLIEEFKTGGIVLPSGPFSVAAVKMSSRALGGSAGAPTRVEYVTRVGSTDYVGGTWTPPIGSFGNDTQNYIQATNPATGLPWTTADLTAATFNYGIESVA